MNSAASDPIIRISLQLLETFKSLPTSSRPHTGDQHSPPQPGRRTNGEILIGAARGCKLHGHAWPQPFAMLPGCAYPDPAYPSAVCRAADLRRQWEQTRASPGSILGSRALGIHVFHISTILLKHLTTGVPQANSRYPNKTHENTLCTHLWMMQDFLHEILCIATFVHQEPQQPENKNHP